MERHNKGRLAPGSLEADRASPLLSRRAVLAAGAATSLARPALLRAQTSQPFRIGEINSYSTEPGFTGPYRKGWQMQLEQTNDLGGIDGRTIEVIARDDGGDPATATRLAAELANDQTVDVLAGGFRSDVGLAISAYALQAKKLYVAGEPRADALVWSQGNRYTYRLCPSAYMLAAMLVDAAAALPAKTWVTVANDDAYGRSVVQSFRQLLTARRSDVRFVGEQWPAWGRLDANAVADALAQPAPDAIFNALFDTDLLNFVRHGNARGLFDKRTVVSPQAGDPEYLDPMGDQAPPGWIVTGYPWSVSDEPSNKQFVLDYMSRWHEPPTMGSAIGAALISAITSGALKSGSTDSETMARGFADATFTSPFGICRFRTIDHQSTLGTYVGRLALAGGRGGMVDWRYVDGASVLPPDDLVRTLRPA
jgi:branched-chain amino acid transport system substrate-binding protein